MYYFFVHTENERHRTNGMSFVQILKGKNKEIEKFMILNNHLIEINDDLKRKIQVLEQKSAERNKNVF